MKNIKKVFISCVSIAAISGFTMSASLAATGTVDRETVRLREEASTTSNILTNLDLGDEVEILSEEGDWYKVKFKTYEGFMYKDYIKTEDSVENKVQENTENTENNNNSVEETTGNSDEAIPTSTPDNKIVYVGTEVDIDSNADVYLFPVITSSKIDTISSGTTVKIIQETNNWVKVTASEKSGWIFKSLIDNENLNVVPNEPTVTPEETEKPEVTPEPTVEPTPEPTATPNTSTSSNKGYINVANANIREKASTTADVLISLTENTEVTILGEENDFYKISASNVKEGYVAKRLVTLNTVTSRSGMIRGEEEDSVEIVENEIQEQEPVEETEEPIVVEEQEETSNESSAQEVVDFAEQFLGYDYVYGGTTPSGFDCSGYTYYVYSNNGVDISRSLSSQAVMRNRS